MVWWPKLVAIKLKIIEYCCVWLKHITLCCLSSKVIHFVGPCCSRVWELIISVSLRYGMQGGNKKCLQWFSDTVLIFTIRLNRLCWFEHVQRMEENRIPKRVLCMNLGTTRLRDRPRNRWQDEVREDGRMVDGEGWQGKVHNREEWKKHLRTARNRPVLHMPKEWMNTEIYVWGCEAVDMEFSLRRGGC